MARARVRLAPVSQPPVPERRSTAGGIVYVCADAVSDSVAPTSRARNLVQLTAEQIYLLGSQSLGLIAVAGAAMGAILALQFGFGLRKFGGTFYVPEIVGLSIFRELGPVTTGLLLAGRIGSGITAELASMNVTEQIDSLRALGDSPYSTLVLPRILACLAAFPILALFGEAVSLLTATAVTYSDLAIGPTLYLSKTLEEVTLTDIWTGIFKTVVFALYVALASCWKGLETGGGTRGIGSATTWIVVRGCVFVLVSDFFLSKLFILTVLKNG